MRNTRWPNSLRLSEVRSAISGSSAGVTPNNSKSSSEVGGGGGSTGTADEHQAQFNFLCVLCAKNKANSNYSRRPSLVTPLDGVDGKQPSAEVVSSVDVPPAEPDEYETKLKERMRWKEQFLMNNNMIDFGPLITKAAVKPIEKDIATSDANNKKDGASPAKADTKINERIEYENTSTSFELFDDDELTKLLNLESEWESEDETT